MSAKKRRSPAPGIRKPSAVAKTSRSRASRLRSAEAQNQILALVRDGVERFILQKTTMHEFLTTLRALTEKDVYAHQLTRSVFRKIVQEAIKKRKGGRLR